MLDSSLNLLIISSFLVACCFQGQGWITRPGGTLGVAAVSAATGLRLATVCVGGACGTIGGMRPTVLIVDDHVAFRASARALLEAEGFHVVGEAADAAGAVEAVAVLRPEIVLLDIQLPDLDGLVVAEQLAGAEDSPVVVLISSRDAAAYGPRLHQTPARGFIPKSGLSGEALAALIG
jgi:CheY-like chemotaxis protein